LREKVEEEGGGTDRVTHRKPALQEEKLSKQEAGYWEHTQNLSGLVRDGLKKKITIGERRRAKNSTPMLFRLFAESNSGEKGSSIEEKVKRLNQESRHLRRDHLRP